MCKCLQLSNEAAVCGHTAVGMPTLPWRLRVAVDVLTTIKTGVQFRNKQLPKILLLFQLNINILKWIIIFSNL